MNEQLPLQNFIDQYNQYISNPSAYLQSNNIGMTQNPSQQALSQFQNTPSYLIANGTNANNANPLINYFNNPEYSLLYGQQNAANQVANVNAGTYNPTDAFHQDPGFDFNIQQAYKTLQQNAAAKGLLNSGPVQTSLLNYASGLQNQNYQQWLAQQNSLYNQQQNTNQSLFQNYQQQLAGLAQFGAGQTGANQAISNAQQMAGYASQNNMTAGNQVGNANLSVSENIAQLLANQGILNANAYLNTGGAMSNNIMQGATMQAQQAAANQSAFNSSQNSLLQAQGAVQGANAGAGSNSNFQGYGSWSAPAANGIQTYTGNPWGAFG